MTFEIIIFVVAALFGILLYWRESKNNYLYRLANKITHSKEQQMKSTNRKGFVFQQPFLVRLVFIVVLFLLGFLIVNFLTPFNIFYPKYFATTVVGTIVGTYFASLIVFANEKIEHSQETIDETLEKGKEYIKEITEDVKEKFEDHTKNEIPEKSVETKIEEKPEKSGRDRLKEKGLL